MKDYVIYYTNLKNIVNFEKKDPKKALKKVTNEFEALFWYEILKGLDKTIIKSGLFPETLEAKIYRDYFYQEVAEIISGKPRGLGDFLYKQLLNSAYFKKILNNSDNK